MALYLSGLILLKRVVVVVGVGFVVREVLGFDELVGWLRELNYKNANLMRR